MRRAGRRSGVAVAARDHEPFALPAGEVQLVSTHGAGDAFTGTLCAALAAGSQLRRAGTMANETAALHVSNAD